MDKCYKKNLFQINKQQHIKKNYNKSDEIKQQLTETIFFMKSCFYKSELDKFLKHINDIFPDVKKIKIVFYAKRQDTLYFYETYIIR